MMHRGVLYKGHCSTLQFLVSELSEIKPGFVTKERACTCQS